VKSILIALIALIAIAPQTHAQPAPLPINSDSLKRAAEEAKEINRRRMADAVIKHFVIKADNSTYGYSIYIDGKLYVYQTTIPAMPGNRGFSNVASAEKTALLVIEKIKQGELPPTLSADELRQRKIIP
jgi:hypothetical protein